MIFPEACPWPVRHMRAVTELTYACCNRLDEADSVRLKNKQYKNYSKAPFVTAVD